MEEQHYQLLDGKAVSAQMKKEMAEEVCLLYTSPSPRD